MEDEEGAREAIRQKRLEELERQRQERSRAFEQQRENELRVEGMLKQALSPEAKSRLSNVRLANSELYSKAVQAIAYLAGTGKLSGRLGEEELKSILQRLSAKREMTIKRK